MRIAYYLTLFSLCVFLIGCETELSENIATDSWYVDFSVDEDGAEANARAEFRVGNPLGTIIRLSAGDEVRINGTELFYEEFLIPHYEATISAATNYILEVTRDGEGSFRSTVVPPSPVIITSPAAGATLSQRGGFSMTWDDPEPEPTGYRVGIRAQTDTCTSVFSSYVSDVSTYTFAPGFYTEPDEEEGEGMCGGGTFNAEIFVISSRNGTMADELRGEITVGVRASQAVTLTP